MLAWCCTEIFICDWSIRDIGKLRSCGGDIQCDCKTSLHLERIPWSNSYSHILKQLIISRFPKLLCIQVQRASLNMFGEAVKLAGNIAFPLVLDLSVFTPSSIGFRTEVLSHQRHDQETMACIGL